MREWQRNAERINQIERGIVRNGDVPLLCALVRLLQIWEFFDTLLVVCERKEDFLWN